MTPSQELRDQLRELIDERIPPGGTDADTRFSDAELDRILQAASTLNQAAAEGWRRKAARALSERGGLVSAGAGDERFEFVSPKEFREHCLQMADYYASLDAPGTTLMEIDTRPVMEFLGRDAG